MLRRRHGSAVTRDYGSTGLREHETTGSRKRGAPVNETRLERGSMRPPIKDDRNFIFTREL